MVLEGFFTLLSNILLLSSRIEGNNSFPHPLSAEKEQEYIRKFKETGDLEARNILIKHNLRLVVFIAKKYLNYPDNDELISIGTLGLIKAINSYDQSKGSQLATYASRCIENEILMTMRSYKKYSKDISIFENIGTDKDGNEMSLIDLLYVEEDSVYKKIDGEILKKSLGDLMKSYLSDREYVILIYRFGMKDSLPRTQQYVADKLGISRSYISRIEKKALQKLRSAITKNNIQF
ncbi:MAG: RNA polymerase sporulation sigma factor SigK [Clostridia bacterium]|nr:RNA polymerase sporulation sigma factor SigK [Clostridia bacterium]